MRNRAAIALLSISLAACASQIRVHPESHTPQVAPQVALHGERAAAAQFVDRALAMLGQPYRYGGDRPGGFDCSGLVAYAARSTGLKVPRTAEAQFEIGAPVARDELRAGDLVFMHFAHKELHVGIAVDATHFVHAPSFGGRVRIDSLEARPYARSFLRARRPHFSP